MLVHKERIYHCKEGEICVKGYQKFSKLYEVVIAAHNYWLYYLNCWIGLALVTIWFHQSFVAMDSRVEVQSSLLYVIDCALKLWNYSKFLAICQSKGFLVLNHLL
jgi:hypothetical protein